MSFLDDVVELLKRALLEFLSAVGRFFQSLFSAEVNLADNLRAIVQDYNIAKANILVLREKLKTFHKPDWKTRVISVPIAIEHIRGLQDLVIDHFTGKLDLLIAPIHELSLIFKAEQHEAGDPQQAVSGLSKAAVKIDEIATCIEQIKRAMETVKDFTETSNELFDRLNGLDAIFLSQGSSRETVTLTYKKRVR